MILLDYLFIEMVSCYADIKFKNKHTVNIQEHSEHYPNGKKTTSFLARELKDPAI